MPLVCIAHNPESWHTIWMSHGTQYDWIMAHDRHVIYMWCVLPTTLSHGKQYEWVMAHNMNESWHTIALTFTCGVYYPQHWVMAHSTDESWTQYECVIRITYMMPVTSHTCFTYISIRFTYIWIRFTYIWIQMSHMREWRVIYLHPDIYIHSPPPTHVHIHTLPHTSGNRVEHTSCHVGAQAHMRRVDVACVRLERWRIAQNLWALFLLWGGYD